MKQRIFLLTLALLTGLATWAVDYGIFIGGVQITSSNASNITADNGFTAIKSGTVTFIREGFTGDVTLTFNNVTIEDTESTGKRSAIRLTKTSQDKTYTLNLVVNGTNRVVLGGGDYGALGCYDADVKISGNGSITFDGGTTGSGIEV